MPALDVAADGSGLRQARRFVADVLREWGVEESTIRDAELLTTELVTNALRHARADARVSVTRPGGTVVRVEVSDPSPALPVLHEWAPDATTGRGLHIVDRLSDAWGVTPAADRQGKTVWFELEPAVAPAAGT